MATLYLQLSRQCAALPGMVLVSHLRAVLHAGWGQAQQPPVGLRAGIRQAASSTRSWADAGVLLQLPR
jgi:hypothetical protein